MEPIPFTPSGYTGTEAYAGYILPNEYIGVVNKAASLARRTSDSAGFNTPDDEINALAQVLHEKASDLCDQLIAIINTAREQATPPQYQHYFRPQGYGPYPLPANPNIADGQELTTTAAKSILADANSGGSYLPNLIGRINGYEPLLTTGYKLQGSLEHGQAIVALLKGSLAAEVKQLVGQIHDTLVSRAA